MPGKPKSFSGILLCRISAAAFQKYADETAKKFSPCFFCIHRAVHAAKETQKRKTAVVFAVWGNKKRILAVKPQNIVRQKNAPQIGLPNRSNKKDRTHKMCPVFCAKIKYFCKLRNKRFCPAVFRPGEWHRTRNFQRSRGNLQDIRQP